MHIGAANMSSIEASPEPRSKKRNKGDKSELSI
jgi:hypothetical protein